MAKKRRRKKPFATVVMISYNGEKLIDDAINSLLKQTNREFEVVMLDDCSTDSTPEKMRRAAERFENKGIRCRVYANKKNRGTGYSWNRAASLAETEWVCFLADDDMYLPERMESVKRFIQANPDVEWFYHDAVVLKESTGERHIYITPIFNAGKRSMEVFFKNVLQNKFIFHNSVAIRKDVYESVGGIRDLRGVEDFDFWMRLIEKGHLPMKLRGPPLFIYRSRGLDSSKFPYVSYYGAFTQSINDFLDRNRGKKRVYELAREFRIGVYISYFLRCMRRGNLVLASKVLGGMVRKDFSAIQFLKMAVAKFFRIFKGEN
ncbi:hypothetical protein DRN67_00460 [Candidatus Micrarchaeota archaeon]|nr:MAG: hypothetical protein DRN67_00460 [Candidatus Micrarchaeota archaeon]